MSQWGTGGELIGLRRGGVPWGALSDEKGRNNSAKLWDLDLLLQTVGAMAGLRAWG